MTDPTLRSLLLHRLSAEDATRLEEAILLDEGFAERVCEEEFDLLADYAAFRLNVDDRRDVERYLLDSDEGRLSLRVTRALRDVGDQALTAQNALPTRPTVPPTTISTSVAAPSTNLRDRRRRANRVWGSVALLAASMGILAYLPQWRLDSSRASSSTTAWPTVSLTADVNRGSAQPSITIAPSGAVRLQAEVPDMSVGTRYALAVQDTDGRRVFASSTLEVHAAGRYRFVEAVVPGSALGPGERTILLLAAGSQPGADVRFSWQVTGVVP